MRPTRPSLLIVLCLTLLLALTPVASASAASTSIALPQEDVANHVADIRAADPDVEDLFAVDNGTWGIGYTGATSTYFKSGRLHVSVDDNNTIAWAEGSTTVGDFYAEVDTVHWEGPVNNQLGIIFRYVDADNFYFFAIGNDGYYSLQILQNDEWSMLIDWTESATIEVGEGETNTLGLLVEGSDITLLINDYIVDRITDDTFAGGTLALAAGAFDEPPVDIGFDDFAVWLLGEPPAPGPSEQLPVRVPERPRTPTPEPEVTTVPEEEVTATAAPEEEVTPTATPEEEITVTPAPTEEASVLDHIDAIRAADPVYTQDFAILPDDWTPRISDNMRYDAVDGALEFGVDVPGALGWTVYGPTTNDLYVEVDGRFLTDVYAEYGILFRYVDSQNFYFLAVDTAGQFSIWRLRQNQWETVYDWTYTDYLELGANADNHIGLLVEGERFTVLANDVIVAEIDDDAFPTGSLALAVGTFEDGNVTVQFDNFAVWSLGGDGGNTVAPAGETPPILVTPAAEGDTAAAIDTLTGELPFISDDFRRDQNYWGDEPSDGVTYEYRQRAFHISISDPNLLAWSYLLDDDGASMMVNDFYAEADVIFAGRAPLSAAGMLVRVLDGDNFYYAAISENGYFVLQKKAGGIWTDLITWSTDAPLDQTDGAVNRFGVLANGSTLALTVNGDVVGEVTDDSFAEGSLALMGQTFGEPDLDAAFDNFDLWTLGE